MKSITEKLIEIIEAQETLLACYRLGRRPPEKVLNVLDKKQDVLKEAKE
jgi:hypothetical protein